MLFKEITVEEFAEIRAREAAKDAYEEGVAKGEKSGHKRGFTEGEKSGIELGAAQKEREIAKNLKTSGIPFDVIAKNTGLTLKEVAEL